VALERPAEATVLARLDEEWEELERDAPDHRRRGDAGEALHRRVPHRVPVVAVVGDHAVGAVRDDEVGDPLADGVAEDGPRHTLVQTTASMEGRAGRNARGKTVGVIATWRVRVGVQQGPAAAPNDREVTQRATTREARPRLVFRSLFGYPPSDICPEGS
jgi:hypothetical protein